MIRNYLLPYYFVISTYFLASTVAREAIIGVTKAVHISIFPYQVSIQIYGRGHVCGGAIIGENHVLTAAHCVLNNTRHLHNRHISVLVGTKSLRETGPPAEIIRVEKVFFPLEFHPTVEFIPGDIALLELVEFLQLDHHETLKKVDLPRNENYVLRGTITGYGWNEYLDGFGGTDGSLRYAMVNVYPNNRCERSFAHGLIQSKIHLCAEIRPPPFRDVSNYGVCHGDAGAPLVRNGSLIGILSRTPPGCDDRHEPEIYTRVVRYRRMILHVMERGRDSKMIELRT